MKLAKGTRGDLEAGLRAAIASGEAVCAVVGLGYIGTAIADALTKAGLRVRGYDRSAEAVERLRSAGGVGQALDHRHPRGGVARCQAAACCR